MEAITIDCTTCTTRPEGCHGCVMSLLFDADEQAPDHLTPDEERALAVLADAGLVDLRWAQ